MMSGRCNCSGSGSHLLPCPCKKCKAKAKALAQNKGTSLGPVCTMCRVDEINPMDRDWGLGQGLTFYNNELIPETSSQAGSNASDCHCDQRIIGERQPDYWGNMQIAEYQKPSLSLDSDEGRSVAFGTMEFSRKSSMTEGIPRPDDPVVQKRAGCSINYPQYTHLKSSPMRGRDTLGLPIRLQGNKGLLNASGQTVCVDSTYCNDNCGISNDCSPDCKSKKGIQICSNETINSAVTFLIEMLGILVFFAICTFTFWITLGYYAVQLLLDLINADRNVHVAVGIVFAMLVLAFAITLLTHGCCNVRTSGVGAATSCGRATLKSPSWLHRTPKTVVAKCKGSSVLKSQPQSQSRPHPQPHSPSKSQSQSNQAAPKSSCSQTLKKRYSDCQGRKIFDRSRRNAILTEMKQPPTWLIWLRGNVNSFFRRR